MSTKILNFQVAHDPNINTVCILSAAASIGELSFSTLVSEAEPEDGVVQPSSPTHNVQNSAVSLSRVLVIGAKQRNRAALAIVFTNTGEAESDCSITVGAGASSIASLHDETFKLKPGESSGFQVHVILT